MFLFPFILPFVHLQFAACPVAAAMAIDNPTFNSSILFFLFTCILICALCKQGYGAQQASHLDSFLLKMEQQSQGLKKDEVWRWRGKNARKLMIGSTAPACTYNECRRCLFKCSAEQVPVDTNDPMNSAYHYRCVCHR